LNVATASAPRGTFPALVLNADDPSVAVLAEGARGPVIAFGVDDPAVALAGREHAADARFCPCGARFAYTAIHMGRKVRVVGLSDGLSRLQAGIFQYLPGKPFTMDNYLSLQVDSICARNGLAELEIHATDIDAVVPGYLGRG